MKQPNPSILLAARFSLFYNFLLLFSVALNLEWAKTRAAGGQYEDFPVPIRILYLFMAIFMLFLMQYLWKNRDGLRDQRDVRTTRLLAVTFFISAMFQLISKSPNEQWNAVPAIILAYTFFQLSKQSKWRQGESNP